MKFCTDIHLDVAYVRNTIFRFIGPGIAELLPFICQKLGEKMLWRELLLHFSTDFNETLHMHTLGCADLHNTIFISIGARVTEFLPIEDIGSPRVHCCFTNTALVQLKVWVSYTSCIISKFAEKLAPTFVIGHAKYWVNKKLGTLSNCVYNINRQPFRTV